MSEWLVIDTLSSVIAVGVVRIELLKQIFLQFLSTCFLGL